MLYKAAFSVQQLHYLFYISEVLLYPLAWAFNNLTSPFLLVSNENHWDIKIIAQRILYPPLILVFLAVFGIPHIVGFILRCLLHLLRRPYVLSIDKSFRPPSINERRSSLTSLHSYTRKKSQSFMSKKLEKQSQVQAFTVCSANICLLPELLSRINNLSNADHRAWKIGERIVVDQFFFQNSMETILSNSSRARKNSGNQSSEPGHSILTHFPKLDFLCLQETWDKSYSHKLMSELHKVFPWIIYDVGKTNFFTNRFMLNSGLMLCSRYEILDADFLPYKDTVAQCMYLSKGLLMAKVQLSTTEQHDKVGYIYCTHLQAYQGTEGIIQRQLNEILEWTKNFRDETIKSSDIVVFDVLCGDFNFDNLSPVDETCTRHKLFEIYEDVCRVQPGQDQEWTVGTEFRQMCQLEDQVSTPQGLKQALEDPILRHRYLIDSNIKTGTMKELCKTKPLDEEEIKTNLQGVAGRRRIDYILYRKDTPVIVENFSFITRLATLTDHIPVSMTFTSPT